MNRKLDPEKTALIVVDMQNDFCHPDGFYARASSLIEPLGLKPALVTEGIDKIKPLLDQAREAGIFLSIPK